MVYDDVVNSLTVTGFNYNLNVGSQLWGGQGVFSTRRQRSEELDSAVEEGTVSDSCLCSRTLTGLSHIRQCGLPAPDPRRFHPGGRFRDQIYCVQFGQEGSSVRRRLQLHLLDDSFSWREVPSGVGQNRLQRRKNHDHQSGFTEKNCSF